MSGLDPAVLSNRLHTLRKSELFRVGHSKGLSDADRKLLEREFTALLNNVDNVVQLYALEIGLCGTPPSPTSPGLRGSP